MYCKNCGKQIDDKAVICVHCGALTDNYAPRKRGGAVSAYRNEFFAPYLGLILSCLGIAFGFISIAGLAVSITQFKRAKAVYGETKYALAGIIVASAILGLMVLGIIVSFQEAMWAGLSSYFN